MIEFKGMDYGVFSKSLLNPNQARVPKKRKYCVKSATESKKAMYIYAYSVTIAEDGTILFLNEIDEIIVGINPCKFSTFFIVDENNNPADVFGDIL